ncbi:EAL domain-containing protein [Alkalihalobacterium bogoriense]|uniref:EAL domain-containing protein n=1 Tax=Alkalihalobacterium bogoriense TaxID=246272 RepID=UPI000685CE0F|nr:EAL domain-containing protein [Alkalihalobacterium bogoriense]
MNKSKNKYILGAIFTYIVLYYLLLVFGDVENWSTVFSRNLFSTIAPLIAAIWLWLASKREKSKQRLFWLFLAIGCFHYFIAELFWMYYESYLQVEVPFPGLPDLFYKLQIFFYLLAFSYLVCFDNKVFLNVRYVFEVLIIMVVAATFSYHVFIRELIQDPDLTGMFLFVSIGYPIGDLLLFFSILILFLYSQKTKIQIVLVILFIGIAIQVVADTSYMYLQLTGNYETGSFFDPLFTLSLLLVGYASFFHQQLVEGVSEKKSVTHSFTKVQIIAPLVSIVLLLMVVIVNQNTRVTSLTVGSYIAIMLVIIRQFLILVENKHFLRKFNEQNKELSLSAQHYRSLFEYHPDPVFSLDVKGRFLSANEACAKLTGYSINKLAGQSIGTIVAESELENASYYFKKVLEGKPQYYEVPIKDYFGNVHHVNITLVPIIIDEEVVGVFGIGKNITDFKRTEEELNFLAYHDVLTGLPNRFSFEQSVNLELEKEYLVGEKLAVLYMDVDRFKIINDTLGHDAGDELLVEMTKRIQRVCKEDYTLARHGGDEFALLICQFQDKAVIEQLVKRIINVLSKPYIIRKHEIFATPSIGVVVHHHGEHNTSVSLLKKADIAMYEAKSEGKSQYKIYDKTMEIQPTHKFVIESDLHKALRNKEFLLHYQPQIDTKRNKMYGVEALIRWNHPTLGLLGPAHFIGIAEETGLIIPIGERVMREACEQGKRWHDLGCQLKVSVNLSPLQFKSSQLVKMISTILDETEFNPMYLELEITEAVAMTNVEKTIAKLQAIQEMGIKVSIDDFGTGYSSLSYLGKLPIHTLKIPREFVRELQQDKASKAIVDSIITLATNLQLDLIAEGVEEEAQKQTLEQMGCTCMQGYLFSKPLPSHELFKSLE